MSDELQTYLEPELEARLVAWVLGEASAFEAEELERLISERPELKVRKEQLEKIHGVLVAAHQEEGRAEWKLSKERRGRILEKLEARQREEGRRDRARQRARRQGRRKLGMLCAACVVIGMIILVFESLTYPMGESASMASPMRSEEMSPEAKLARFQEMERKQAETPAELRNERSPSLDGQEIVDSPKANDGPSAFATDGDNQRKSKLAKALSELDEAVATKADADFPFSFTAGLNAGIDDNAEPKPNNLRYRAGDGLESRRSSRPESVTPARKPTAPGSSSSRVIAANSAQPAAVPVPEMEVPTPLVDLGDGDDLGDGWGGSLGNTNNRLGETDAKLARVQDKIESAPEAPAGPKTPLAPKQPAADLFVADGEPFGSEAAEMDSGKSRERSKDARDGQNNYFLGGDTVGGGNKRDNHDFINPVKRVEIPGIPATPQDDVRGIVTGGNRSGAAAIDGLEEEAERKRRLERENFETSTAVKSDSTFSLNVSDVSFKLAKAALAEGKRPEVAKVRAEEFVNALDYGDARPTQAEKISGEIEQGAHPFMSQRNLMRVAMSTASLGRNAGTPLRLTLLLDQSGSMERVDRVRSLQRAFALLAAQLNANDEVTLIGFARTPRLLAERVKGNEMAKLAAIIANPLTEGGTNLEEALASGLQLAKQQFLKGAQNRIILLTDGAANLGDAKPETLARQVESMREAGIAFDACGVGADGLNDEILSALAKQGDGRYYLLDRPEDADEGFARQIAGALRPAAKNVKVQVLFNPERVTSFKLYGFEKHQLKKEDFRNDAVDAAEMAAEESGVALYHFEPNPAGRGEVGTVSVRFLDTASNEMVERTWLIPYEPQVAFFNEADPKLRLAGVAGLFAESLKGSPVGERVELKVVRQELSALRSHFGKQTRFGELETMLRQAGE